MFASAESDDYVVGMESDLQWIKPINECHPIVIPCDPNKDLNLSAAM